MTHKSIRVLIAKPGLDGHDRGARLVTLALRDAGFEVIYSGLHQTVAEIAGSAMQEDVDVIGLSILSGAHLPIAQKLMDELHRAGLDDMTIIVGGNIPEKDIPALKALGVAGVFPTGSPFEKIATFIQSRVAEKQA